MPSVGKLPLVDLLVLGVYLAATVGMGVGFAFTRRRNDTEQFVAAGRSLPGWAVGLSMFGSYVSSISFLANPGKAFAADWNFFVFSLATPIAALVAVIWFVPFYRRLGEVSAYEHFERRFGPWARTYAVACFLLLQVTRMGTIIYLLSLPLSRLTGQEQRPIIPIIGAVMIVYSVFGGIRALVWIGVVQSVVLIAGPVICLAVLLWNVPGGAMHVVEVGSASGKFGLGSLVPTVSQSTFWVVLLYGLAINLGNFGTDQSYVQRYITTRSERDARRSVWITTAMYVPTAAFFFFIGTTLFVLFSARPDLFTPHVNPAARPDDVFPAFIAHHLPVGLAGLVVASICAASLDSNLSSMATLTLRDVYQRYFRPGASDAESMLVLRASTVCWGALGAAAAMAMLRVKTILDVWWELAGIFSGGVLGLFLLGMLCRRAGGAAAAVGVTVGVVVILWMTLSPKPYWPAALADLRNPMHPLLIPVVGTLTVLLVGVICARLSPTSRGGPGVRPGLPL